jgi:5-methyltetrahydrofolate--homocysteine methyltransferase
MIDIREIVKERILVLDGAMGTMIQRYGLTEEDYRGTRFRALPIMQRGNNDLLPLTRPDIISDIHRKYLEAGADIIETCSFCAQRVSMADYGLENYCREMNLAAAKVARQVADEFTDRNPDKPRFVAGSIGPTNKSCSMSPDINDPAMRAVTFGDLVVAYSEQIEALLDGGVDMLLIETIFDTLNAKAAIFAARKVMSYNRSVPVMLSVTLADKAGRMLSGQNLKAFCASVLSPDIFSIGLNCSFGAKEMRPYLEELASIAPCYISAYPNAGLPNSMGEYDQSAEQMAEDIRGYIDDGLVNIVGGCCGTTDRYTALFSSLVVSKDGWKKPHVPVAFPTSCVLSGLDVLELKSQNNFINIGERCNVAGSRKFLRLIKEGKYESALDIARKQVEDGAQVLDINLDDGLLDAGKEMVKFLNLLASEPEVSRVPLMIDSSDWEVVRKALRCVQGKCVVNSISLKEGERSFLEHAAEAQCYNAAVVVMAFDEHGQATTYERKIEICKRAYDLLVKQLNFNSYDIIFDPNILAVCTGIPEHDTYALDFIRATRWIREHLEGAHVSGGISNLSFSFRGNNYIRECMHSVFLYHAIEAGMDMGIVNPSMSVKYDDIPSKLRDLIEDILLNRRNCSEELIRIAEEMQGDESQVQGKHEDVEKWRSEAVGKRLARALVRGDEHYLSIDLQEAIEQYRSPLKIIEGPLMDGMKEVGNLFGCGKMFLPQVIKTARTMKAAVNWLEPYLAGEKRQQSSGKILIATVKGDVHDIGKNIVSVILGCNNYQVIDMGVMCSAADIVQTAIAENVDAIGLSGLITPSLEEMVNTARACDEAGLCVPLLLGGATTSAMHTALKVAPVYRGVVAWVRDASQIVSVLSSLLNPETRESAIAEIKQEQFALNKEYKEKTANVTLQEARNRKLDLFE